MFFLVKSCFFRQTTLLCVSRHFSLVHASGDKSMKTKRRLSPAMCPAKCVMTLVLFLFFLFFSADGGQTAHLEDSGICIICYIHVYY